MGKFSDYKVYIEETHHIHKLDKPSGTAITLAQGILDNHPGYKRWQLDARSGNGGGCTSGESKTRG